MTWTKLSDNYTDQLDLLGLSRSARLLDVEGLIWCNRNTTDGYLPRASLRKVTDSPDPESDVAELVTAARWTDVETGWQLDWSDQDSAEDVRARQEYRNAKQKRYRDRKARHERGDHSECDPRFCRSVTGNADGNETGDVTPSRPVPSRPKDRGQGQGAGARSAGATRAAAPEEEPTTRVAGHEYVEEAGTVPPVQCDLCGLPPSNGAHRIPGHEWQPSSNWSDACAVCHGLHEDEFAS